jgi:hydroxypyruvate isomerase
MTPLWVDSGKTVTRQLREVIRYAISIAQELQSKVLAVLIRGSTEAPIGLQRQNAINNLRALAPEVADAGLVMGIEPMILLPDMFLQNVADALTLVREVNHAAVQIIFDTGHVQMMDQNVLGRLEECAGHMALIQLADQPGRVEPGAGQIDFVSFLECAVRGGYTGLFDLEHGWLHSTPSGEQEGLARIQLLDKAVGQRLGR